MGSFLQELRIKLERTNPAELNRMVVVPEDVGQFDH